MQPDPLPREDDTDMPGQHSVQEILEQLKRLDAEATAREMAIDAGESATR